MDPNLATHSGQTKYTTPLLVFAASNFARGYRENLQDFCRNIALGEKIISWEFLRMSISKFSGHMGSKKPNVLVTVLSLGLRAKLFGNLRL